MLVKLAVVPLLLAVAGEASGPPPQATATDAPAISARAATAMQAGRYRDAIADYEQLTRAHPDNAGLQMNLGIARVMAGDARRAVPALQQAVQLDASLAAAWRFLGSALLDLGRPGEAVEPLRKALATGPGSLDTRRLLAQALLGAGRPVNAAEEFRRLTDARADDPEAWYGLVIAYGDLTQEAFAALHNTAPDSPYDWVIQADLAMAAGEVQTAVALLEKALARLPALGGVRPTEADAYGMLGRAAEAAAARAKEAELVAACTAPTAECAYLAGNPLEAAAMTAGKVDAPALFWRTRAYNELAAQAMERLDALPPSPQLHLVRAMMAEGAGQHQVAVEELRQARKLDRGNLEIGRRLALALIRVRNPQEAMPLVRELIDRAGDDPQLLYLLGETQLQAQQVDEAIRTLEAAFAKDPSLIPARASLGRAYAQAGRLADAVPHLEAARETDEDGSLHFQLARAYQAVGRAADARAAMAEYQKRVK